MFIIRYSYWNYFLVSFVIIIMRFYSYYPYSACGLCQSIFLQLVTVNAKKSFIETKEATLIDIFIVPSLLRADYWPDLQQLIKSMPFPRRIIAIGDQHANLEIKAIYVPEYTSVEVIEGCPPSIADFISLIEHQR